MIKKRGVSRNNPYVSRGNQRNQSGEGGGDDLFILPSQLHWDNIHHIKKNKNGRDEAFSHVKNTASDEKTCAIGGGDMYLGWLQMMTVDSGTSVEWLLFTSGVKGKRYRGVKVCAGRWNIIAP